MIEPHSILSIVVFCVRFTGGHPGPHTDACFVYDHAIAPGTNSQWSRLPSLPMGRAGGGLTYSKVFNAIIYAGGAQRNNSTKDFPDTWMYVLGSSAGWVRKANIPYLSNHKSYVSAVDNMGKERLFYLGGQKGGNEGDGNVDDNYEYDPINDRWIERAKMLFGRGHANSSTRAVSCGFIIAAGTRNVLTVNVTGKINDIHYYDIPTNTWTSIGGLDRNVNTPVCDIDFVNGYLYCLTPGQTSKRIKIVV
jgi:hypothetical protein